MVYLVALVYSMPRQKKHMRVISLIFKGNDYLSTTLLM